jgi:hypothetical protein
MNRTRMSFTVAALAVASVATTHAQTTPTSQPKFLQIIRESVKAGRSADHAKWEAGWPAAFEKAGSKNVYMALSTLTGPQEAWFIVPFASQGAYGDMLAEEDGAALGPEMERLSKGDAEFISSVRSMQAVARPELSQGQFPDMSKVRFYEITTIRVKPGYGREWDAAMQAYKASAAKAAPGDAWRTYEVVAGAPGGTYLLMSSTSSFADFDKMAATSDATWKGIPADEMSSMTKFFKEGLAEVFTQRFRVEPGMSYVDAATKAKDPAFWSPKK